MSLKRIYIDQCVEICLTCKFIDEYAFNVSEDGKVPHGYDGWALCCLFDENKPETDDNLEFISPLWKSCKKYEKCTFRQAQYLDIYDAKKQRIIKNPNDISKINQEDE